jgi:hypothetical protein
MSTAFYNYIYNRTYALKKNLTIPIATSPTRNQINECYDAWNVKTNFTDYQLPAYENVESMDSTSENINVSWHTKKWKCQISNNEQNKKTVYYQNSMPMSTNMRTAQILKYQQTRVPTIFAIY